MSLQTCTKIAIGWVISVGVGIYAFRAARKSVNAKKLRDMKARQLKRESNIAN